MAIVLSVLLSYTDSDLVSSISLSLIIHAHVFYQYLLSAKRVSERVLMGVICLLKQSHTLPTFYLIPLW